MKSTIITGFRSLGIAAVFALCANNALACLQIPIDPPPVWVEVIGPQTVRVVLHDYSTYGASQGSDYCACALNIPAQFGLVQSAQIVDIASGQPLPGFSFGTNSNTGNGFDNAAPLSPPEFWSGFSSAVSQAVAAGTPVDLVFTVFNPETQADPRQLANYLRNVGNLVATDAADQDGVPTGAHQAIFPAGDVGMAFDQFGVHVQSQGTADISQSGGTLVVSNIGSSGLDGVRFVAPPSTGASIEHSSSACAAGGHGEGDGMRLRTEGTLPATPNVDSFFDIDYGVSGGQWQSSTSSSADIATPSCYDVEVYDAGRLQGSACVAPGASPASWSASVCPSGTSFLVIDQQQLHRVVLSSSTSIVLGNTGSAFSGNEVRISNPLHQESMTVSNNALYGLTPDSFFDIFVEAVSPQYFGNTHDTFGGALYASSSSDHLTVDNIGHSGKDGISIGPGGGGGGDVFFDIILFTLQDPDNGPTGARPPGSSIQISSTGQVQGNAAPVSTGHVTVLKQPDDTSVVRADFSPVGSSSVRLELYNNGSLVTTFENRTGDLFAYFDFPDRTGKLSSGWPPGLSCFVQEWNTAVEILIPSQTNAAAGGLFADEVRILAEDGLPVSGVSSISLSTVGVPELTFTGEVVVPQSDTDLDGVADASDNCVLHANADQTDTDGDGYGNRCDPDMNNNCVVNFTDLGLFKQAFTSGDPDADFNANGVVNFVDLGILKAFFGSAPGPSGLTSTCSP